MQSVNCMKALSVSIQLLFTQLVWTREFSTQSLTTGLEFTFLWQKGGGEKKRKTYLCLCNFGFVSIILILTKCTLSNETRVRNVQVLRGNYYILGSSVAKRWATVQLTVASSLFCPVRSLPGLFHPIPAFNRLLLQFNGGRFFRLIPGDISIIDPSNRSVPCSLLYVCLYHEPSFWLGF